MGIYKANFKVSYVIWRDSGREVQICEYSKFKAEGDKEAFETAMDKARRIAIGYCFVDPKKENLEIRLESLKEVGGEKIEFNKSHASFRTSLIDYIMSL